eukprot:5558578-Pyramimonas_sp.AAC.1
MASSPVPVNRDECDAHSQDVQHTMWRVRRMPNYSTWRSSCWRRPTSSSSSPSSTQSSSRWSRAWSPRSRRPRP